MAAQPEVLQGRSNAKRTILASPQDELALTVGDTTTFAALEAQESAAPATRDSVVSSATAARESLAS